MTPASAKALLTPERIALTAETLSALDTLQALDYVTNDEARIRQRAPHSDSHAFELARLTLREFTLRAPPGNAQQLRMLTSAFINGLQMLAMEEEMMVAIRACAIHEDPT